MKDDSSPIESQILDFNFGPPYYIVKGQIKQQARIDPSNNRLPLKFKGFLFTKKLYFNHGLELCPDTALNLKLK